MNLGTIFDINTLRNVSSEAVKSAVQNTQAAVKNPDGATMFDSILGAAVDNINTTNSYLSDAENAEISWALGETDNTHDLSIALRKASTVFQYTVAIRDKFMDAYKEIMQMQI